MEAAPVPKDGRRAVGRNASKASQRPRILDAITELVAAHGYAGTTVREIARTAGVSLSTFYEHFASKEECFLAAYDQVANQLFAAITAETRRANTPREALDVGIEVYFKEFAAHPSAAATFVVAIHTAGPKALARRAKIHERYRELVALAPKAAARRRGTKAKLPDAAIEAITYTNDAMTHDYVRQGRAEELPGLIPRAQALARHILRV
jgi:AcrR family transcriptional regulator